jgi:hypothetical protein
MIENAADVPDPVQAMTRRHRTCEYERMAFTVHLDGRPRGKKIQNSDEILGFEPDNLEQIESQLRSE